jgi:hypothetical protein
MDAFVLVLWHTVRAPLQPSGAGDAVRKALRAVVLRVSGEVISPLSKEGVDRV